MAAIERYEWNKSQRYQSIVAMVYLTWNMAQNIQVSEPDLFRAMKTTMMRSLEQSVLMKQFALKNNIPVRSVTPLHSLLLLGTNWSSGSSSLGLFYCFYSIF